MSERSQSPSQERFAPKSKGKKTNKNKQSAPQKISQSGQSKITNFFKAQMERKKNTPKPVQALQMQLEQQLQLLNQEQQRLIAQYQKILQSQKQEHIAIDQFRQKSKAIIRESLKQQYERKREEKNRVDLSKGFLQENGHKFIRGQFGKEVLEKVEQLKEKLKQADLSNQRKAILQQCLKSEQQKWLMMQRSVQMYRQRLKVGQQEKNCTFSKQWPLLADRYQVLQLIGRGGFSEVYRAYDLDLDRFIAIKYTSFRGVSTGTAHYVVRQYENHKKLNHPNIAQLYDVIEVGTEGICIAMEFCQGPELSQFMKRQKIVREQDGKQIVIQILKTLHYLNSLTPKIIHYDLKPQNIMLEKGTVKILDFGLSKQIDNENSRVALTTQGVGTYWYLPPQTFNEKSTGVNGKVDIWSTGIIFFQMLYGRKPFGHNMSQMNILKKGVILNAFEVQFPNEPFVSEEGKNFIRKCLAYNVEDRLDPLHALEHNYFK